MHSPSDLVALAAIINADPARLARIDAAAAAVDDWGSLVTRAETEGVAPILYHHLKTLGFGSSSPGFSALRALAFRHRHATEIRVSEFSAISSALAAEGIECAALKGVALAGLIYPEPGHRPMRDIDFLVGANQADATRALLEELGYRFERDHPSRYMRLHHHLPNATRTVDGLTVSVEVHTSANSGDTPGRTTLESLQDPLQNVETPFGTYRTLGDIDMLNQLCRHALEPGGTIRLVSVMDIQGYCQHFDDRLEWSRLGRLHPYIPGFLRLTDPVVPLPAGLHRFHYDGPPFDDPGRLIPTVGAAFGHDRGRTRGIRRLLDPPRWWFRCYYGIDDDGRGAAAARVRHLARVGVWLGRRAISRYIPAT